MKKSLTLLAIAALSPMAAESAAEEVASPHSGSGNIAFTSDYVFRGVSQTQNSTGLQGGADYAHSSGFYAGVWGSNVSWVSEGVPGGYKDDNSMEIDLYGGFKGSLGEGLGYDLGVITYYYPGDNVAGATDPDSTEIYAGVSFSTLSFKYSRAVSEYLFGWGGPGAKSRGSYYVDLTGSYDLGNGWGLVGHVGHQKIKNTSDADYTDWKLAVTKDLGIALLTLAYTDTNADEALYTWNDEEVADGRVALTLSKTF